MNGFNKIIMHLFGLMIFVFIQFSTVLIENISKFPFIASRLPSRVVAVAEQEVKLYQCEDFSKRIPVRILAAGETVTVDYVACGSATHQRVVLSDGRTACFPARDEDKMKRKILYFYYF